MKLSIILPSYNERDNIRPMHDALAEVLRPLDLEMVYVDDNSPDGSADVIQQLCAEDARVKLVKRPGKLGLSSAIVDGCNAASGEFFVVCDVDCAYDLNAIHKMLELAADGADIVVGSRYMQADSTEEWSTSRFIISRCATALANTILSQPVTDPLSGYALLRRSTFLAISGELKPRGYKFLLEVLVKCRDARVAEVPTTFHDRERGKSKFGVHEIVQYLRLWWELARYRMKAGKAAPAARQPVDSAAKTQGSRHAN